MSTAGPPDVEPRPLSGEITFEEGDFHALSDPLCKDPQYDDRRLVTRRKLGALGKRAVARLAEEGLKMDSRTSLHRPTQFNGMRVRRVWTYITRGKAEKKRLRSVLGSELAKDLDAAYRNAYLCVAVEAEALEVSLRLHSDGWYDGQNLVNRVQRGGPEGLTQWKELLNELSGFRLRLHDWKGEWVCGDLTPERLEEFLSYYKPGEHALAVEQRLPAPAAARGPAVLPGMGENMLEELMRLMPLYRFTAWSKESDFLFGS